MRTQTFTGELLVLACSACGVTFGLTTDFDEQRRADHASFSCPAGHWQAYSGRSALEKERDALRSRLATAERSEDFYRRQVVLERRRAAAQKGQRTRVLNLITKGVCPVAGCRRNFRDVREHMATQHPDFHTHEDAAS